MNLSEKVRFHGDEKEKLRQLLSGQEIKLSSTNIPGEAYFEPHSAFGGYVQFSPLHLGAFSFTQSGRFNNVKIGRYCSIAPDVVIGAPDHPTDWASTSPFQWSFKHLNIASRIDLKKVVQPKFPPTRSVSIGNDVWIGHGALIVGGVSIGNGAIVGAGSVVTKDIPPYAIVGGVPARIIRYRFDPELIASFEISAWWRYAAWDLVSLTCSQPRIFLKELEDLVKNQSVQVYTPNQVLIKKVDNELEVSIAADVLAQNC